MSYSIDTSKPIWRVTFRDVMTSDDVAGMMKDLTTIETKGSMAANRLVDATLVKTVEIGFTEIWSVVKQRKVFPPPNKIKTALVTGNAVQFGIARMFQGFLDHPLVSVQVFSNEQEAMQWLESKSAEE